MSEPREWKFVVDRMGFIKFDPPPANVKRLETIHAIEKSAYDSLEKKYLELRDGHEHVLHKLQAEADSLRAEMLGRARREQGMIDRIAQERDELRTERDKLLELSKEQGRWQTEANKEIVELRTEVERLNKYTIAGHIVVVDELRSENEELKRTEKVYRMNRDWIEDAKVKITNLEAENERLKASCTNATAEWLDAKDKAASLELSAERQNELAKNLLAEIDALWSVVSECYPSEPDYLSQWHVAKELCEARQALGGSAVCPTCGGKDRDCTWEKDSAGEGK